MYFRAALVPLVAATIGATPLRAQAPTSAFSAAKAEALLRDRLPCLGCHRLDGAGGRIGPDLSAVGVRRTPAFIAAMIRDPRRVVPGTIMPRVPMPPEWVELIASYLAGRDGDAETRASWTPPAVPAAPADADATEPAAEDSAASLYSRYCASCHGAEGEGDGYNAPFLPVPPTAHADRRYMSKRSDDALFDAIYAGGRVMGRSPRMPPFGHTLERSQIRALVDYLRKLCRCEGPAWSRDGAR